MGPWLTEAVEKSLSRERESLASTISREVVTCSSFQCLPASLRVLKEMGATHSPLSTYKSYLKYKEVDDLINVYFDKFQGRKKRKCLSRSTLFLLSSLTSHGTKMDLVKLSTSFEKVCKLICKYRK